MSFDKIIWLLDPRFDFTIPWFEEEYSANEEDILFVGSYHGSTRTGKRTNTVGDTQQGHIEFLEPEDINRRFWQRLKSPNDKNIMLVPFTGAYLPSGSKLTSPISTGKVAKNANNKWWQYDFFKELGVKTPETWKFEWDNAEAVIRKLLKDHPKLLIKAPELSGGHRMTLIKSPEEFLEYRQTQKPEEILLASEYIDHTQSFAGMGIVREDGSVFWCGATEQVLYKEFAYEGLIYPPFASETVIKEMEEQTKRIGTELAKKGYFGYFNVDYIFTGTELYAVELNARFGFGTIFYACCCGSEFWKAVRGKTDKACSASGRIILGKIKGKEGRAYSDLKSESDILAWYSGKSDYFQSFFCGCEEEEIYDYGSFIGVFGKHLTMNMVRYEVLEVFWSYCLGFY